MEQGRVRRVVRSGRAGARLRVRAERYRADGRATGLAHTDGGVQPGGRRVSEASSDVRVQRLEIPDFALVVLIGATGSGKSHFAAKHFKPTEVISSDYAR